MKFRRPQFIPLAFIIGTTLLLVSLGLWQAQRLVWKNNLIARIETAQAEPALTAWQDSADYRNIEIEGTFIHDRSLHLVGRPKGSSMGFFILTPLQLEDGKTVLVNRGWAPEGEKIAMPGASLIRGVVRPAREKRYFSPDNQPEKNVWFYEDIPAMSRVTNLTLENGVIEAVGTPEKGIYPQPGDGKISLRNDHLGYAITWFALAAIGLIMFAIYHRIPERKA